MEPSRTAFDDDSPNARVPGTDPFLGQLVLDYRVSRLLKAGPNGRVYAARSVFSGHPVAIKLLRPSLRTSPAALAKLQREQWFLREAGCLAIPRFLGAGGFRGVPWYLMDRLEGYSLQEILEARSQLFPTDVTRILYRVARMTEELHSVGLSHGRLSASGLVVGKSLQYVSLLDVTNARPVTIHEDMPADLAAVGALFAPLRDRTDEITAAVIARCCSRHTRYERATDLCTELAAHLSATRAAHSTPRMGVDAVTALDLRLVGQRIESGVAWLAADEEITEVVQRADPSP